MPIENERKYVLNLDPKFEIIISENAKACFYIEQGYVACESGFSIRLRKKATCFSKVKKAQDISYLYTIKKQVNGNTVELENKVSQEDFDLLWPHITNKLKKYRYLVLDEDGNDWEVDFFKHKGETYLILAEIELPPDVVKPKIIPDIIKENCIHIVDKGDSRFSAKRLGDAEHAAAMLKLIRKKLI